ncbi:murein hydrolase activator EnvC family protein [Niallia taxi]|uniref:murein hydrolase activator EnvC family protein n=1 Tax=Niallia taxi TaxID=2499688 RepID=UPI00217523B7|nr:M23 family metallopeptidase [Niallia taxi]
MKQTLTKSIVIATTTLVVSSGLFQSPAHAISDPLLSEIEKEIQALKNEQDSKQSGKEEIREKIDGLFEQEATIYEQLTELDKQIATSEAEIEKKMVEVQERQIAIQDQEIEIQKLEDQLGDKFAVLEERLNIDYKKGKKVSYLKVLMGSDGFGDFVSRVEYLTFDFNKDRKAIDEYLEKKETIEAKKVALQTELGELDNLMNSLEKDREWLASQLIDKQTQLATTIDNQQELINQEEKESQEAMKIADSIAGKYKEMEELKKKLSGVFAWPVPSKTQRVSSSYGYRVDPINGTKGAFHKGQDIAAPEGTTIVAAEDGVVITASYINGYGNAVIIQHSEGFRTLYGHIRNGGIKVSVGQQVKRGQKIAEIGSTGRSTGNHLHFELLKDGKHVDPNEFLPKLN